MERPRPGSTGAAVHPASGLAKSSTHHEGSAADTSSDFKPPTTYSLAPALSLTTPAPAPANATGRAGKACA